MLTALVQFFIAPDEPVVELTSEDIKRLMAESHVLVASCTEAREALALAYGVEGGEAPQERPTPRYEALRRREESRTASLHVKFFTS